MHGQDFAPDLPEPYCQSMGKHCCQSEMMRNKTEKAFQDISTLERFGRFLLIV